VAESRLLALSDDLLGDALRELGDVVAFPIVAAAGRPDLATRVRVRIVESAVDAPGASSRLGWFGRRSGRPMRRGLVLAIAALLVLAAIAGAIGFGLPGLRIIFGPLPSPSLASPAPSPSLASPAPSSPGPSAASASPTPSIVVPLGSTLGLGAPAPLDRVEQEAGFDLILPPDPAIGLPDAAYISDGRVALVWATKPGLPETTEDGVGLLINEFPGTVDQGYFLKVLDAGTTLTPVKVGGLDGYWISGNVHFFMYVDREGNQVFDEGRIVGDTLIWTSGKTTYRLESALGKDAAIRLAESLR
jgi:hypothetical protein